MNKKIVQVVGTLESGVSKLLLENNTLREALGTVTRSAISAHAEIQQLKAELDNAKRTIGVQSAQINTLGAGPEGRGYKVLQATYRKVNRERLAVKEELRVERVRASWLQDLLDQADAEVRQLEAELEDRKARLAPYEDLMDLPEDDGQEVDIMEFFRDVELPEEDEVPPRRSARLGRSKRGAPTMTTREEFAAMEAADLVVRASKKARRSIKRETKHLNK